MAQTARKAPAPRTPALKNDAASLSHIDTLIKEVVTSNKTFNDKVQEAAIAILEHAKTYGDCSRAKVLARAVPSRLRNMLVGWFALYSPIGIRIAKNSADDQCRFIDRDAKKYRDFNVGGAKAVRWDTDPAKVAKEPPPLNTLPVTWERIDMFFKRLIDGVRKEDDKNKYAPEDRAAILEIATDLQNMANKYHVRFLAKHANDDHTEETAPETPEGETTDNKVVNAPLPRQRRARKAA